MSRDRVYVSYRKLQHRLSRLPSSEAEMWREANDATFCVLSNGRVFDEFSFHPKVTFVVQDAKLGLRFFQVSFCS